ncbi:MAG: helix-turn-helix transcriptional regulator [Verrucomicrobiales bacterium]|nr:helix-turn-helix transcriptional regulator [Verrucomicrobiales bacterium]
MKTIAGGDVDDNPIVQSGAKREILRILEGSRQHFGLTPELVSHEATQEKRRQQVRMAIDYLHRHYDEKVRLEDVARVAGMSVSHFKTVLREIAGMSFSDTLIRIRVEETARLLRESELSVAEIAHDVGFSDQSHLVRRFRGIMGETPTHYRRKFLQAS